MSTIEKAMARKEWLAQQAQANGKEDTDPTPVEVPLHFRNPPTIKQELQRYVRYELHKAASDAGFSTFEEEDDFDIDDEEPEMRMDSPYMLTEEQVEGDYQRLDGLPDSGADRPPEGSTAPESPQGDSGGQETPPNGQPPTP